MVNLRAGQRPGALPRWRWLFRRLILAAAAVHGVGGDMEPPRAVRGVKAGIPIFLFSVRTHSPTDWPVWKYSGDDTGVTPVSNRRPSEQAVIRTFNPALPRIRKIGYGRDRPPLSIPFNDFIHAIHPPVHLIRVIRSLIAGAEVFQVPLTLCDRRRTRRGAHRRRYGRPGNARPCSASPNRTDHSGDVRVAALRRSMLRFRVHDADQYRRTGRRRSGPAETHLLPNFWDTS